jgi:hypothetical protein
MKSYSNIEKSAFRHGEYVGYGGGKVWHISKSNSSFGTWFARNQDNANDYFFGFGLQSMSNQLHALNMFPKKNEEIGEQWSLVQA